VEDLLPALKEMEFTSLDNKGIGFETEYRARGMGDFVFFCDPGPYYEASEDAYIQQVTKVVINKGGLMTCCFEDVPGLPVQIKPLVRPYALWTGNVFRGVVQKWENGEYVPVPFAEIEVEFANYDIDMENNAFEKEAKATAPNDAVEVQTILANKDGEFSYAVPKAGWWGFAALGAGGDLQYEGKELSLDAVIWCYAYDMKR
jgi:cobalt/nickel transport protein